MGIFDRLFKPNVEKLEEKKNVRGLIKVLGDSKNPERGKALDALRFIIEYSEDEKGKWEEYVNVLRRYATKEVIMFLEDYLIARNDIGAGYLLAVIGDKSAVELLIKWLSHPDHNRRRIATKAPRWINDDRFFEPLVQMILREPIHSPSEGTSTPLAEAVRTLGQLGNKRAVEPLIELLKRFERFENFKNSTNFTIHVGVGKIGAWSSTTPHSTLFEALLKLGDRRAAEPIINSMLNTRSTFKNPLMKNIFGDYADIVSKIFGYEIRKLRDLTYFSTWAGEEFEYSLEESDDALQQLCEIHTQISNNLLHKMTQKRDTKVLSYWFQAHHEHQLLQPFILRTKKISAF